MGISERMKDEEARRLLLNCPATGLLHGVVSAVEQTRRWVRPLRFSDDQMRAFGSCQAWHPGLYRQMARTTAGIRVEFETNAREVALEVRVDTEPKGTRSVLALIDRGGPSVPSPHDGLSADVDGRHVWCGMPAAGTDLITIELAGNDPEDALGLQPLPGMDRTRRVRIWLPALRGCVLRNVICDGTFVHPVPKRKNLLVLGDSIVQGFVSEDPAFAWPSLLADKLRLDLVNQGLGGQVFQPGSLFGLADAVDAERIVIAFGENYRYEPCVPRGVSRDVRSYLSEVDRLWPQVPTHVISPLWHDEGASPSHAMSCHERVPELIAAHASAFEQMTYVDGLELLDHDPELFADGCEHPGERGCRQVATRVNAVMRVPGLRPSSVGKRRKKKATEAKPAPPLEEEALRLPLA